MGVFRLLEKSRAGAPPPKLIRHIPPHRVTYRYFERSRQESFGDALSAMKCVFGWDSPQTPLEELTTLPESVGEGYVGVFTIRYGKPMYHF